MAELVRGAGIFENYNVRLELYPEMLKPAMSLKKVNDRFDYISYSQKVVFRTYLQVKENGVLFCFLNEAPTGRYPEASKGNYVIRRGLTVNHFDFVKIYFQNSSDSYVKIIPKGRNSSMSVYLFGAAIYTAINLPVPIETCITMSFTALLEMTHGVVDWEMLLGSGQRHEDLTIENIVSVLMNLVAPVREATDGALDDRGNFVFIDSGLPQKDALGLNCSGFMKWIVDGFYQAITGLMTGIPQLKQKHIETRGNRWTRRVEDSRDPYFGLDWIRNCAVVLSQAQEKREIQDIESRDVRSIPFYSYIEDVGYPVERLKQILFYLSHKNPGFIYLGTINDIHQQSPVNVEYYHVTSFFPYFDHTGVFKIVVMDQHKDFSPDSFIEKYKTEFIHLVSIDATTGFNPVEISY